MTDLYLGLGSNLGDRERLLHRAVEILVERIGGLKSLSAFYETEPWGFCSDHPFLNAVAVLCTEKTPEEILRITQAAERELGRRSKSVGGTYADRPIDIDLLLYDDLILSTTSPSGAKLILPHPLMAERDFVMKPLAEIAPGLVHPVLGKTIKELTSSFSPQ